MEGYRIEGRYITAKDVSDRLMPDLDMNELLLWSPDLFAFTSYILTITSAYQLVVSPPSGKKWQPDSKDIKDLLKNSTEDIKKWHLAVSTIWGVNQDISESIRKIIEEVKDYEFTGKTWTDFVQEIGVDWRNKLDDKQNDDSVFKLINDVIDEDTKSRLNKLSRLEKEAGVEKLKKEREKQLLSIILRNTPAILIALWASFYNEVIKDDFHHGDKINISDLLCNQDHIQNDKDYCPKLWKLSQILLSMHAISDEASGGFGIRDKTDGFPALKFAEKLLFTKGSVSTFTPVRCRVLPKRHNPSIGITLRSISSNLAFYQSSVDVVWRKTKNKESNEHQLGNRFDKNKEDTFSLLLIPYPFEVRTRDFDIDKKTKENVVGMSDGYGFFDYESYRSLKTNQKKKRRDDDMDSIIKILVEANKDLPENRNVDMILFPEAALNMAQFSKLEKDLTNTYSEEEGYIYPPNIIMAGVSESKEELAQEMNERYIKRLQKEDFNFSRNVIYCKYYDEKEYYKKPKEDSEMTPKYKQYKHHRWQLDESQITRYGLSGVLNPKMKWWESIKIPKRRVSFLNVGDRITISHLICEDLARQDPISELIRQVGPSLVVTILMDGPQLKSRWSARYATVLSDDPGSSVIALTSLGMVKRHSSDFGLMSRVVALWSESGKSSPREIELSPEAKAILLTFRLKEENEKTADGREEINGTSIISLLDVIQIYPDK